MKRSLVRALLIAFSVATTVAVANGDARAAKTMSATDLGDGSVDFGVSLPSGQAYVELFVRQNGIQNIATPIVTHAIDHGDGTTTYHLTVHDYRCGDRIEYRFYSYLPQSPGVFTPGPAELIWSSFTYGSAPADVEVYYAQGKSRIQPVSVGWQLVRANPSPFSTPLLGSSAKMLGVYVRHCDGTGWVRIDGTPFTVYSPTEHTDAGIFTWSGYYNGELPGTRIDPRFECGGNDITISTLVGPQTLRTNTTVDFAYVVEHLP
jgi:hypothetical protein